MRTSALTVLMASVVASLAVESSFLRPGERVACLGDSVTFSGGYVSFLQETLSALYPDSAANPITADNLGVCGARIGGGAKTLQKYLADQSPTLLTCMFGVNDTGWSTNQVESKVQEFTAGLGKVADMAREAKVPLLLLRESPFSHGREAGAYETRINTVLRELFVAQDRVATDRSLPVIDLHGAFWRGLADAWAKDPRYEFTPDIVHPVASGHSAMAVELLRSLGAGLPLAPAGTPRGALRLEEGPVRVMLRDSQGRLDGTELPATVLLHNSSTEAWTGTVRFVVAGTLTEQTVTVAPQTETTVPFSVRVADLPGRWDALPAYACFVAPDQFAAGGGLLWYSRCAPRWQLSGQDFHAIAGEVGDRACPVGNLTVECLEDSAIETKLRVAFDWHDTTPVPATAGFKTRFGTTVESWLDLSSRPGDQPADAVEFFVDTRPPESLGRWTASVDEDPTGVVRIGVCRVEEGGNPVLKWQARPGAASVATVEEAGEGRYLFTLHLPKAPDVIGFSVRVTDATSPKRESGPVYVPAGRPHMGHDPMGFLLLSRLQPSLFHRFGY